MSYRIQYSDLKKLRLIKEFNKLSAGANDVSDYTYAVLSNDEDFRNKTYEEIDIFLNFSRKIFKKGKFVVHLLDAYNGANYRNTFIDIKTGEIDYLAAFKSAFDYSAVLYMKSVKNKSIVDGATFAIMNRRDELLDFEIDHDVKDFDEIIKAMLANIDGTNGKVNTPMSQIVGRNDYLLYLLLPRLDSRITMNHRDIYTAFINGDSTAFDAILDSV